MGGDKEEDDEPDKMQIAFGRIGRFIKFVKSLPKTIVTKLCKRQRVGDSRAMALNGVQNMALNGAPNGFLEKNGLANGFHEKNGALPFDTLSSGMMNGGVQHKEEMIQNFKTQIGHDMNFDLPPVYPHNNTEVESDTNNTSSYPEEVFHEEVYYYPVDEVIVEECCPAAVYRSMPCCAGETHPFWQVWNKHRLLASKLIENKYFETIILILILISSFVMTLEDIWFETRPTLIDALYYLDRILTVVFFLETTLKLFAMGFVVYFGNAWCWLDFVIVAVSLINFGASLLGAGNIAIFKTMRTLRALRPLRAMAKMEGIKLEIYWFTQGLALGQKS